MESAGALSALLRSRTHHHTEGFDPCEPNHRGSDPSFNSTTGNATRVSNRCVDGAHDRGAAFVRLRRAAHPIGFSARASRAYACAYMLLSGDQNEEGMRA